MTVSAPSSLFPLTLLRVAGIPFQSLEGLRLPEWHALLREAAEHEAWRSTHSDRVCDALYAAVPGAGEARRTLLNLKRDVHNGRPASADAVQIARAHLGSFAANLLMEWCQRMERQRVCLQKAETLLRECQSYLTEHLQAVTAQPALRYGLPIASLPLHDKLNKYLQTPPDKVAGRLRRIEHALVLYLSRVAAKSSPFSTFTPVTVGTWSAQPGPALATDPHPYSLRSLTRVGHLALTHLAELLAQHAESRPFLSVRPNPHVWAANDRWQVLTRYDDGVVRPRLSHLQERVGSLAFTPQLQQVLAALNVEPPLTFDGARNLIAGRPGAEPAALQQAGALLERLLAGGLLQIEPLIPEQAPDPAKSLAKVLEPIPGAVSSSVRRALDALQAAVVTYQNGDPDQRAAALVAAEMSLRAAFGAVGHVPPPEWLALPLREDTALAHRPAVSLTIWEAVEPHIALLQRCLPLLDDSLLPRLVLRDAFVAAYGAGATAPLLTFYDHCRRRYGAQLGEITSGQVAGVVMPDTAVQVLELREAFDRWLIGQTAVENNAEVALEPEQINAFAAAIPYAARSGWRSYSYLAQVIAVNSGSGGPPSLVLNAAYAGFGHLARLTDVAGGEAPADNPICQGLLDWQRSRLPENEACAEILGTFGYNVNLHPPLTPLEIQYPGSRSLRPADQQVALTDLHVRHDEKKDHLVLMVPGRFKQIHLAYLSALIPSMLPPTYRFVLSLSVHGRYVVSPVERCERLTASDVARTYPRVRLGHLIVSRRTWVLPLAELPVRPTGESELLWQCRVERWRQAWGLPERVFIRNRLAGQASEVIDTVTVNARGDVPDALRKPQYIDFASPHLVDVFTRHVAHVRNALLIEEVLPGPDQLAWEGPGGGHASELLLITDDQADGHD